MQNTHRNDHFNTRSAIFMVAGVLGRVMAGGMLLLIAALLAIATAIAGVALACAALIMRYASVSRRARTPGTRKQGDGLTLDARPTPRGWTVET